MMKNITFKSVLRILSGLFFLIIGLYHFYDYQLMAVFVPLPFGSKIFVILVGTVISIASIGIIVNRFFRASMLTIGITLALTALMIEVPAMFRESDEILKMLGLSNLVKLTLACGVLLVLAFSSKK